MDSSFKDFFYAFSLPMEKFLFTSERLGFRNWQPADRVPFARMNEDPQVMEFMPTHLTREQSDSFYDRIQAHFKTHGFGLYAVQQLSTNEFIGYTGFQQTRFEAHFTPCFEIGWRLAPHVWNQGLATEGGKRCLEYAFNELNLTSVCSFTAEANKKAQRVIEKIGLTKTGTFDHPMLEEGHWLRKHVLYHMERPSFN